MQKICVRIDFEKRTRNKNKQFKIVQTNFQNGLFFTKLAKKQSFV